MEHTATLESRRDELLRRLAQLREKAQTNEWLRGELDFLDSTVQSADSGLDLELLDRTLDYLDLILDDT